MKLELFSDAKAKNDRFGITDTNGNPVWHGKFFDNDPIYNGEQSSGELAAAMKAVWLASKVAEEAKEDVELTLYVDAEWLTWATNTDGKGGKALQLGRSARKLGVQLTVEHVRGNDNPADYYTTCEGFMRWQDGVEFICHPERLIAKKPEPAFDKNAWILKKESEKLFKVSDLIRADFDGKQTIKIHPQIEQIFISHGGEYFYDLNCNHIYSLNWKFPKKNTGYKPRNPISDSATIIKMEEIVEKLTKIKEEYNKIKSDYDDYDDYDDL